MCNDIENIGTTSSVSGDTSKRDIKLGEEDDELTEMPICPHGGRIRDPKGSEDVWGSI